MSKNNKKNKEEIAKTSTFEKQPWFDKKLKLLLDMLAYNTPHKFEEKMHKFLPKGGEFDSKGNYIYTTDKDSKVLFCCHIDTVGSSVKEVKPIYENGWIKVGNKNAHCLGGDDRCGILCLLTLIEHKIPGTYIFHIGEECGLIGARFIEKTYKLDKFDMAIEFDRRGETSVITEMGHIQTCSDDFAEALCSQLGLGFKPDDTGISTDTRAYQSTIAECTNISVGYRSEHHTNETINADFLINGLLPAIVKVNWASLPVVRDPSANNRKIYQYHNSGNYCGGYSRNYEYEWDDCNLPDKYNMHTVDSFTNHEKLLRSNGISETNGDLIKDSDYVECELCAQSEGPFSQINILGTDYLLCEDCSKFLLNGWDENEFDIEKDFGEEMQYLFELSQNEQQEQQETEDDEEE